MGLFSRRKAQEHKGVEIEEGWPTGAPSGFLVFDVETTGLSPATNRILEIGVIRVDPLGKPLGYWSSLVNPQGPVGATHIHGIRESDVVDAPTFDELVGDLLPKLHGQVLVAHNASFDRSFLKAELGRVGWSLPDVPVVCTMAESKHFLPALERRRLSDCAEAIGIRQEVEHRALGDATLTTAILHFYLNGPVDRSRSAQLSLLPTQAAGILWPSEPGERIAPKSVRQRPRKTAMPVRMELLESVSEILPDDLLGDSPSTPQLSYANLLLSSLDDGVISESELLALSECADIFGLSSDFINNVHTKLLRAVVREAWRDGAVSRNEQQQIIECAQRLGLDESLAKDCLREVEELRAARLGAQSKPIPTDWGHGDPLRVGDRVVITGCYDQGREDLENRARGNGLKVTGSVSGKTKLLVSDGSVGGNKDNDAQRLGIRIVRPEVFRDLLDYIQPNLIHSAETQSDSPTNSPNVEHDVRTETLVCITCGQSFQRVISRGRKPHECEGCRSS